jgi:amidase
MRIGVVRQLLARDTDPEAEDFKQLRAVLDRAFRDLVAAGAEIVDPVEMPPLVDLIVRSNGNYQTEAALDAYLADLVDPPVKTLQELVLSNDVLPFRRAQLMGAVGKTTDDIGYLRELHAQEALRRTILTAMADYRLDALVYGTLDHPPAVIPDDILTRWASPSQKGNNRFLAAMLGYPAMSVPAGFTEEGLPVGMEILGRPFAEGMLLRIASGYEQATHHRRAPAPTPALPGELLA